MKKLLVFIVTYRRLKMLEETIDSLIASCPPETDIVVVDNDAFDPERSKDALNIATLKGCGFLPNHNGGWANAVNLACHDNSTMDDYEYVLLSNNDVKYHPDWWAKAKFLMEKYPEIGVLGLWKHKDHGEKFRKEDLVVKDDMPATCWLFRPADLKALIPFEERGQTFKRGGLGEDTAVTQRIIQAGKWVAAPIDDLAEHLDGYDNKGGEDNPAYV